MSYTKNTWTNGDVITAAKLNNIEGGIDAAANRFIINVELSNDYDGVADKSWNEVLVAWNAGQDIWVAFSDDEHIRATGITLSAKQLVASTFNVSNEIVFSSVLTGEGDAMMTVRNHF